MLDRIKQMAVEAGLSRRYGDDIPDGDDVVIADQVTMLDARRFARAVARECCQVVDVHPHWLGPTAKRELADAIRARFGIAGE